MAIVNVTPDSFSEAVGGDLVSVAIAIAREAVQAGADFIDIGGESTRPGAVPVSPDEEQLRVLPVIAAMAGCGVPISVDTRNAATMRAALAAGASIVNDVSGLRHDPASAVVVAEAGCRVVLMHMRGTPATMQGLAHYEDLLGEVLAELEESLRLAEAAGVARERIALDPGIGFAKAAEQNIALLRGLPAFASLGLPILVGVSRKRFIGAFGGEETPSRRDPGSLAAGLFALSRGASVLRVHDVAGTVQGIRIWRALESR